MKAFRIDMDGVTEIEAPEDFFDIGDTSWDCFSLNDDHDVWVDDMGLFGNAIELAAVGSNGAVPLPAFVFGAAGERTVAASMTIEDVRSVVTLQGRRQLSWSTHSTTG